MGRLTRAVSASPAIRRGAAPGAYDRHLATVFGLAQQVTGDPAVAEELAGDTFAALDGLDATTTDALGACLVTDVHRRAVRWVRDERIAHAADIGAVAGSTPLLVTLPADEREVIVDAYFGGRTYAEIAQQRGLDPSSVAALMQRGLRRLSATQ